MTDTLAEAVKPAPETRMVAEPGATAVTRPPPSTVATPGSVDVQVNPIPGTAWPDASVATATMEIEPPGSSVEFDGDTVTLVTGPGVPPPDEVTVTTAVPVMPRADAVMEAVPG